MKYIQEIEQNIINLMNERDETINISFNPHSTCYLTTANAIAEADNPNNRNYSDLASVWVSSQDKEQALATNRVWTVTIEPIGWQDGNVAPEEFQQLEGNRINAATLWGLLSHYSVFKPELESSVNELESYLLQTLKGEFSSLTFSAVKLHNSDTKEDVQNDWVDNDEIGNTVAFTSTIYVDTPVGHYDTAANTLIAAVQPVVDSVKKQSRTQKFH